MFVAPTADQASLCFKVGVANLRFAIPEELNPQALREHKRQYADAFAQAFDSLVSKYDEAEAYLKKSSKRQRRDWGGKGLKQNFKN